MNEADWLEEFPPAWPELRADFLCNPYRVTVSPERYEGDMVAHYSIPQVQETGGPLIEPADDIDSTKLLISKPTLLVSKLNPRKRTICIAEPQGDLVTLASGEFVPIQSDQFDQRYGYYVWLSEKVTDRLSAIVQSATRSHQRVNPADILKLPWKWPPLETQKRIATFLDEKTAQIDALIARKQALLARLAEKRQAIITQAVTKGLNPAAPLKDSGIDWLGHIPAHWEVKPLRWYIRIRSGEALRNEDMSVEATETYRIPVIGGNGLMGYTSAANSKDVSIIIGRVGALCGNIHAVPTDSWITDNALGISQIRSFDLEYLILQLKVRDLNTLATRNAQPLMTGEIIKAQWMAFPPIDEQRAISVHFDTESRRTNEMETRVSESVAHLNEYRSALITSAVTGLIEGLR